VITFKASDRTGSVLLDVWGETGTWIYPGDILRIINGETRLFRDKLHISPARSYGLIKRIGQDTFHFNEMFNVSELDWTTNPERPGPLISSNGHRHPY
jgi:hypothetical protein